MEIIEQTKIQYKLLSELEDGDTFRFPTNPDVHVRGGTVSNDKTYHTTRLRDGAPVMNIGNDDVIQVYGAFVEGYEADVYVDEDEDEDEDEDSDEDE